MLSLLELRRRLHRNPELSGRERATAALVAGEIRATAPDILRLGVGGHGVLAVYKGDPGRPAALVRADIDAIPAREQSDAAHSSAVDGAAHLCGHDGHATILVGLARRLAQRPAGVGDVFLLWQPAEETGDGARAALADPALADIRPAAALALHNIPGAPKNSVVVRPGCFCPASAGATFTFDGRSAHASQPELGLSPAVALSRMIDFAQRYAAERQPDAPGGTPRQMATVVHALLGEPAFGSAPGHAELRATLRALDDRSLADLAADFRRQARSLAREHGLRHAITLADQFPAVANDDRLAALVARTAHDLGLHVVAPQGPMRWSEDFAHFGALCPACLFGLGAGEQHPGLHSAQYDFPDDITVTGIRMFEEILKRL